MEKNYLLVFFLGTTATGKSSLALDLAQEFNACIVNADSVQIYDKIQVGAAKPTKQDLEAVDHFLYGTVEPPNKMTAGKYYQKARSVIKEQLEHRHVFVVGGSGFYVQALEKGMYPAPSTDPDIIAALTSELETLGNKKLYEKLKVKDPEAAKNIAPEDSYRVIRALAIIRQEGRTLTEVTREFEEKKSELELKIPHLKIGMRLDRVKLREVVTQRVSKMIHQGLENEVKDLIEQGLEAWAPLSSVGYKETVDYIHGLISKEEWSQMIITNTMQLAKRQMTWFKRDKSIHWFDSLNEKDQAREKVSSYLLTK